MLTVSFSQAIPGPVAPMVIPSNLYMGFKEEYSTVYENSWMQYEWNNIQSTPTEEQLNLLLGMIENFGSFFL